MVVLIHLPSLTCSVVIVWHEILDWCCGHGQMLPIGQLSPTCFVFGICHQLISALRLPVCCTLCAAVVACSPAEGCGYGPMELVCLGMVSVWG